MIARSLGPFLALWPAVMLLAGCAIAAPKPPIPPAKVDVPLATGHSKQTAVFAGGCFWGTQAVFERVKGVLDTTVGYSGGSAD
jgi:peptide-methionine (S)-S-oxide reductase